MVAVVSGSDLGLFNTSLAKLGQSSGGSANVGEGGASEYVNLATGNLVFKNREDLLIGHGLPLPFLQTYNSQGLMGTAGGWLSNFDRSVSVVSGTINTAGSSVQRTDGDGAVTLYQYDQARGLYYSDDGSGSEDTLAFDTASNQWTWTEGSSRSVDVYDSTGRLTSVADAQSGASFTLSYDTNNRLSQLTDDADEALVLTYNANGQLSGLGTLSGGVTTAQISYGYDSAGRLQTVTTDLTPDNTTDSAFYTTTYAYDGTSLRLASVTQSDGSQVSFTYEQDGSDWKVKTVTQGSSSDGSAQTTTFDYSTPGQTDVTDDLGRTWSYTYDAADNLTQVISPAANGQRPTTTYAYDANNRLQSVTDANQNQITYTYDAQGNITTLQNPTGATITRSYNADNQLLTQTIYTGLDPANLTGGETARYVYDANDRLRFTLSAAGEVTEHQYLASGNGTGLVGLTRSFLGASYDTSGLANNQAPTEVDMATWAAAQDLSQTTQTDYTYDVRGQLDTQTTYASVDASGNGVKDGTEQIHQYVYDAQGLLRQSITWRGDSSDNRTTAETTSYAYDGLGRLLASTDATGVTTTRIYDDADHILSVQSANGLITTEVRNAAGELVSRTQSDGVSASRTTRYYYDAAGQLRARQDASDALSYMFYGDAGRLAASVDATGAVTTYGYDADGHRTQTTQYANLVDTTAWLDSGTGQVTAQTVALNTDSNGITTLQFLDASGTVISVINTDAANDRSEQTYYDAAGKQVGHVDADGYVTQTVYDGAGQIIKTVAYANAIDANAPALESSGPLSSLHLNTDTLNDRVTRNFYDADGRQVATLDAGGYLTEQVYDRAGNVIKTIAYANATDTAQRASGDLAALRPATDGTNDLVERNFFDYAGNKIGNLSAKGFLTTYVNDAAGNTRKTRFYTGPLSNLDGSETLNTLVQQAAAEGGSESETYVYDANGHLHLKTDRDGTVVRYVYDKVGHLTETYVGDGSSDVREDFRRYDVYGNLIGEMKGQQAADAMASLAAGTTLADLTEAQLDALYTQYGTRHEYDALGRLTDSIDNQGNKTWYFYDADGRLTHTVKGEADANGNQNALGEVTETVYNTFGEKTENVNYEGKVDTSNISNLQAAISAILNAQQDSHVHFSHNRLGLVAQRTDSEGYITSYAYNAFGQLTDLTSSLDASHTTLTKYLFDQRGNRTDSIQDMGGLGFDTHTEYDAYGRIKSVTDANGHQTVYEYADGGREITTTRSIDGRNRVNQTSYDAFGRTLSQIIDVGGLAVTTSYSYDDVARTLTTTTADGVTVTTRNRFGETTNIGIEGTSYQTSYDYDANGNLIKTTDGENHSSENEYDSLGHLYQTTDADGNKVRYQYDAAGRVLSRTVDPDGLALTTRYEFDGKGQAIRVTDANGHVTRTDYDRNGNQILVTVDEGGLQLQTQYSYDAQGRKLTVTQGYGTNSATETDYHYDATGRLTSKIVDPNALAITTNYAYDQVGNLVRVTDADGNITRNFYNEANQQLYTVNALGDVRQSWYDTAGRLVSSKQYATALNASDLSGLNDQSVAADIAALVQPDAGNDVQSYRIYDAAGKVSYEIDPAGAVQHLNYDASGRVTESVAYATAVPLSSSDQAALLDGTLSAGDFATRITPDDSSDRRTLTLYDKAGRTRYVLELADINNATVATVSERQYDYAGNLTAEITHAQTLSYSNLLTTDQVTSDLAGSDARITRHFYDSANRMQFTIAADGSVTQNTFDSNGNVVDKRVFNTTINSASLSTSDGVLNAVSGLTYRDTSYVYDNANRLLQTTDALGHSEFYTYYATGLKSTFKNKNGDIWNYAYDRAGRMTDETAPPVTIAYYDSTGALQIDQNVALITHFEYDKLGNLRYKHDAYGTSYEHATEYQYDKAGRQTGIYQPKLDIAYSAIKNDIVAAGSTNDTSASISSAHVTYDALGRAVVNLDARGNYTYKVYDQAGRVKYDVDAAGNVTEYAYDSFGDQTLIKRYSNRLNASGLDLTAGTPLTRAEIASNLVPDSANDRTLTIQYDVAGRKTEVVQAAVSYYTLNTDPANLGGSLNAAASPTTTYKYDAYGEVVLESVKSGPSSALKTRYYYDSMGRKTLEIDAEGYVTVWSHTATGEIRSVTEYAQALDLSDPAVSANLVTGDILAYIPAADDKSGLDRIVRYEYDALGRKTTESQLREYQSRTGIESIGNLITSYEYDNTGDIKATVVNGVRTESTYDANGHLISKTGPEYQGLGDQSNTAISATALSDGLDTKAVATAALTTYTYDAFGNKVEVVRFANGINTSQSEIYNPTTNLNNEISYYRFDSKNQLVMQQDAAGYKTYNSYDAAGNLVQTDYDLEAVQYNLKHVRYSYSYDAVGHQIQVTLTTAGTIESIITKSYNAFGELNREGEANLAAPDTVIFSYDQAGRLVSKGQNLYGDVAGGVTETYGYDLAGRRVYTQNGMGEAWSYQDKLGRTVTEALPSYTINSKTVNPVVSKTYDRWGNVTESVDARGFATDYYYNQQNQVTREVQPTVKVVDVNGQATFQRPETDYYYDIQGRNIAIRDANSNTRRSYYAAAGQLVREEDAYDNATLYAYNALGNQTFKQDALGQVTYQNYNKDNQVVDTGDIRPDSSGNPAYRELHRYFLNRDGDRLSVWDSIAQNEDYISHYAFDARKHILISTPANGVTTSYTYDYQGRRISYKDGKGTMQWSYENEAAIQQHTDLANVQHIYTYSDNTGLITNELLKNSSNVALSSKNNTYYANGWLATVTTTEGTKYVYEYDLNGNRTSEEIKTVDGYGKAVHTTTSIQYDSHNRISRVITTDDITGAVTLDMNYEYDAVGNRRHIRVQSSYNGSTITVKNAATSVVGNLGSLNVRVGKSADFAVHATELFQDADEEDLTYTAALSDGSALPPWLSYEYDSVSKSFKFSAAPDTSLLGQKYTVAITAKDGYVNSYGIAHSSVSTFTLSVVNDTAPVANTPQVSQIVKFGKPWSFAFSASKYFTDADLGDTLSLSVDPASLSGTGLSVDNNGPGTLIFSGTATGTDRDISVVVTATDEGGMSVTKTLTLKLRVPAPPTPASVSNQQVTVDHYLNVNLSQSSVFTDSDGDDMQITAALSSGAALPSWLHFTVDADGNTPKLSFTGTPPDTEANKTYTIRLTATDVDGSATTDFSLVVNPNRPPAPPSGVTSVTLSGIRVHVATDISLTASQVMVDPDGDPLTYHIESSDGLNWSWLQVADDGNGNLVFTGTPPDNTFEGSHSISLVASDGELTGQVSLHMDIIGDHAPVLNDWKSPVVAAGHPFTWSFPEDLYTDADGDAITYQVYALITEYLGDGHYRTWEKSVSEAASWLNYDSATRTFSGIAPASAAGQSYALRLYPDSILHEHDTSIAHDFSFTVGAYTNQAPTHAAGVNIADQTVIVNQSFSVSMPSGMFIDPEDDALTYDARVQIPAHYEWQTVIDRETGNQIQEHVFVDAYWTDLNTAGLGFTINKNTGNISGTAPAGASAYPIQIYAIDANGATSSMVQFNLNIEHPPQSPAVITRAADFGTSFSVNLLNSTGFYDPDGETINLQLASGSSLPSWLTLTSDGHLTGTAPSAGTWTFNITATDSYGLTTTAPVQFTAVNVAPVLSGSLSDRSEHVGRYFSFSFGSTVFTDANNEALTYTAQLLVEHSKTITGIGPDGSSTSQTVYWWAPAALPTWLHFSASAREFYGTPPASTVNDSYRIQVTAADASGAKVSSDFYLYITNNAPRVVTHIPDQSVGYGASYSYQIPSSYFTDPNGDALTYSASGMPSGIGFTASTRKFSGSSTASGSHTITVTVKDPYGAYVQDSFVLTVAAAPSSGGGSGPIGGGGGGGTKQFAVTAPTGTTHGRSRTSPSHTSSSGAKQTASPTNSSGTLTTNAVAVNPIPEPTDPPSLQGTDSAANVQDYWFTYDKDNRVVIENGKLVTTTKTVNGQPVTTSYIAIDNTKGTSYEQLYDATGRVANQTISYSISGTHYTQTTRFEYDYTSNGSVQLTFNDINDGTSLRSSLQERRVYNLAGQLTEVDQYYPEGSSQQRTDTEGKTWTIDTSAWLKHKTLYVYDSQGRLYQQTESGRVKNWVAQGMSWMGLGDGDGPNDVSTLSVTRYYQTDANGNKIADGYDVDGNLIHYEYKEYLTEEYGSTPPGGDGFEQTNSVTIQAVGDSWKQVKVAGSSTNTYYKNAASDEKYDVWGNLVQVTEHAQLQNSLDSVRYFAYNDSGQILYRESGTLDSNNNYTAAKNKDGTPDQTAIIYGYSANGEYLGTVNDAGQINFVGNATNFSTENASDYTVQAGDNLQTIAERVYGNQQLWYIIADANGLQNETDVTTGQVLKIPVYATNLNDSSTFKPYDPSSVVGSTTPNLPYYTGPQACLQTLKVVSIIITAVCEAIGAYYGGAIGAGIGAGVGNAISQELYISRGYQDHFDWKQNVEVSSVAYLSAGITEGFSNYGQLGAESGIGSTATTSGVTSTTSSVSTGEVIANAAEASAVGYVGQYALARALHDDSAHFNLGDMAAGVASAAAGAGLFGNDPRLGGSTSTYPAFSWQAVTWDVVSSVGRSGLDYLSQAAFTGHGHWNNQDAFGNVVGNVLASEFTHQMKERQTVLDGELKPVQVVEFKPLDQLEPLPDNLQLADGETAPSTANEQIPSSDPNIDALWKQGISALIGTDTSTAFGFGSTDGFSLAPSLDVTSLLPDVNTMWRQGISDLTGVGPSSLDPSDLRLGQNERYREDIMFASGLTGGVIKPEWIASFIGAEADKYGTKRNGVYIHKVDLYAETDNQFYMQHPEMINPDGTRIPIAKGQTTLISEYNKIKDNVAQVWYPKATNGSTSVYGLGQFTKETWLGLAKIKSTYLYKDAFEKGYIAENGEPLNDAKKALLLGLRANPKVMISSIAQLALQNYNILNKEGFIIQGQPFSAYSSDTQAQLLYIMHHEGYGNGPLFLNDKLDGPTSMGLLRHQIPKSYQTYIDNVGSSQNAYYMWLWKYTNDNIQPSWYRN